MVNMNEGDPKHTHEKAKGCVSTVNMDEGRQKCALSTDEAKGGA